MGTLPGLAESIVIGVVSGVITAVAVAAFLLFVRKVTVPWYQAITYSGIDISGDWFGVDPELTQRVEIRLKQSAKSLKGTAIFNYSGFGNDPEEREYESIRTFKLNGLTQDRFVTLTLRHTDGNRLGLNCYLMEIIGDGRRMAGVFSFFCITTNQIEHSFQILYRDKHSADKAAKLVDEDLAMRRKELLEELKENERQLEVKESAESNQDA